MTKVMNIHEQIGQNWLTDVRKGACAAVFIEVDCENGLCTLRIRGRFATGADLYYLSGKLDHIQRLRSTQVLADFSEVLSIGSTGLTFVINLYRMVAQESGGRLILAGANPLVRQALGVACISKIVPLTEDVDSAIEALLAGPDPSAINS